MRQWLKLTVSLLFLFGLVAVLFAYAMFQGGFVSWFLFFGCLPIILYQLLFIFYPIRTFRVSRTMPADRLQRGDTADLTIEINRMFPFPLSYSICEEILPETLQLKEDIEWMEKEDSKTIFLFGFRKTIKIPYTLSNLPRGEHKLKAIRIRTGDLFGWVKKEFTFPVENILPVYPRVKRVSEFRSNGAPEEGNPAIRSRDIGSDVSGIREYIPGDRLGFINWKQTAKKNKLMTKEFEQENGEAFHLILNHGFMPKEKAFVFETAVELVHSLAHKWMRESVPTTVLLIGKKVTHLSLQAVADRKRLNSHLMQVQPEGTEFSMKLKRYGKSFRGTAILVTAFLDESYLDLLKFHPNAQGMILFYVVPHLDLSSKERALIQQMRKEGMTVQFAVSGEGMGPLEVRQQ